MFVQFFLIILREIFDKLLDVYLLVICLSCDGRQSNGQKQTIFCLSVRLLLASLSPSIFEFVSAKKIFLEIMLERNTEVSKRGQKGRFSPLIDNHQKGFHTEKKTAGGVFQTGTSQNTKYAPDPPPYQWSCLLLPTKN